MSSQPLYNIFYGDTTFMIKLSHHVQKGQNLSRSMNFEARRKAAKLRTLSMELWRRLAEICDSSTARGERPTKLRYSSTKHRGRPTDVRDSRTEEAGRLTELCDSLTARRRKTHKGPRCIHGPGERSTQLRYPYTEQEGNPTDLTH